MDGDDRTAAERRKACQPNQSSSIHQAEHAQNPVLALAFLTLLAVQAGHEAEHLVELLQRFVLHFAVASGILGQFFHPELLHLAYNLLLFWLLLLVYTLSGAQRPRLWRRGMASWWLLTISFVIQSFHLFEHFVKMWQFVDTGRLGTPGILGHEFDLIWSHFLLSTFTYLPVTAAFWLGGFHRHVASDLRLVWTELIARFRQRAPSGGSPALTRRALLIGAAGMAATIAGVRLAVAVRRPSTEMSNFEEVTSQAGITFRHQRHERAYVIQAGAAFFDFNGNGRQDIFLTNSDGPNALYRNNGNRTFTDIASKAGVANPDEITIGVACADYDNDGNCDLLITQIGGLKLLHNNGDGTFTDVTDTAGLNVSGDHPTSAVWADFDRDGHLDLYVTYWLNEPPPLIPDQSVEGLSAAYTELARRDHLFRNNGDGTFEDVTEYLRQGPVHGAGLAVGFFDYDDDGLPDLYVVNDYGLYVRPNILYRNVGPAEGGWAFKDVSKQAGADAAMDGMGLAVGDYDGDSRLDLYATNIGKNILYQNRGGETFEEKTSYAGVGRASIGGKESVGWGTAFLDFNNDGLLDLYFVAGKLYPEANAEGEYPPDQPNALFQNLGDGTFRDVSKATGADHAGTARGLAVADFDGDGFLDLLVANIDQRPALLRNSGNGNHWIKIRLVGTRSNRDGIGARLVLRAGGRQQIREIHSGTSFLSQNSLVGHFGLGQSTSVDQLTIKWPSGAVQTLANLPVDQEITATEPA